MTKYLNNPILILIFRLVVGFIFLSFGASKINIADKFASEIGNYALMPEFSLNIIALILPWLELMVGIFLILGIRLRATAIISSILLIIFIIAVLSAMIRGLDINCGCSSTHPQKVGIPKILENFGLLILSILIIIFPNSKLGIEYFANKMSNEIK